MIKVGSDKEYLTQWPGGETQALERMKVKFSERNLYQARNNNNRANTGIRSKSYSRHESIFSFDFGTIKILSKKFLRYSTLRILLYSFWTCKSPKFKIFKYGPRARDDWTVRLSQLWCTICPYIVVCSRQRGRRTNCRHRPWSAVISRILLLCCFHG